MRTQSAKPKESALELKYCERCGGLWLRPAGGGQIYCGVCVRAIAELPPPSTEVKRPRRTGKKYFESEDDFEGYRVSETDFDDAGGVA
jgi:Zn-finger nucleic acid-binding protein